MCRTVHQRVPPARGDQHLPGTGLAQFVAVLARLIDVKVMMGMLDDTYMHAMSGKQRNQLFQQGGLAGTAEGGKAQYRFGMLHCQSLAANRQAAPGGSLCVSLEQITRCLRNSMVCRESGESHCFTSRNRSVQCVCSGGLFLHASSSDGRCRKAAGHTISESPLSDDCQEYSCRQSSSLSCIFSFMCVSLCCCKRRASIRTDPGRRPWQQPDVCPVVLRVIE